MLITTSDARALDTVSHFFLCLSVLLAIGLAAAWTSQSIHFPLIIWLLETMQCNFH